MTQALEIHTEVVLHARHDWRGQFSRLVLHRFTRLSFDRLMINHGACDLSIHVSENENDTPVALACAETKRVIPSLLSPFFPGHDNTMTLALHYVRGRPVGSTSIRDRRERGWQWMHVKLTPELVARLQVWLDEQLTLGRLTP